jgi:hypothetical protein
MFASSMPQPRSDLKAQQFIDLKAVASNGMSAKLQYLVVTLTNDATRRASGRRGEAACARSQLGG